MATPSDITMDDVAQSIAKPSDVITYKEMPSFNLKQLKSLRSMEPLVAFEGKISTSVWLTVLREAVSSIGDVVTLKITREALILCNPETATRCQGTKSPTGPGCDIFIWAPLQNPVGHEFEYYKSDFHFKSQYMDALKLSTTMSQTPITPSLSKKYELESPYEDIGYLSGKIKININEICDRIQTIKYEYASLEMSEDCPTEANSYVDMSLELMPDNQSRLKIVYIDDENIDTRSGTISFPCMVNDMYWF
jgi:hypothetical protein